MIIIGFEGLIRSGKTTITKKVSKELNGFLIPEYGIYTDGSSVFPKFPAKSMSDAISSIDFFIKIEEIRLKDIEESSSEIIIVDRTYLTCLAFDYAASKYASIDFFNKSLIAWKSAKKICPDIVVYLDVSDKNLNIRLSHRKNQYLSHFYNSKFNKYMREFYRSQKLITINANKPINKVVIDVLKVVNEFIRRKT